MIIDKKSFYAGYDRSLKKDILERAYGLPEKKSPIDARTESNEVKSDPKVLAKNKKKFFINCFGCKIYYE
jgi:hypothetical protein